MTALVCRFTPSALIGASSFGPSVVDGAVAITAAQMGYMLEAIDWRTLNTLSARKRLIDLWLTDERAPQASNFVIYSKAWMLV